MNAAKPKATSRAWVRPHHTVCAVVNDLAKPHELHLRNLPFA